MIKSYEFRGEEKSLYLQVGEKKFRMNCWKALENYFMFVGSKMFIFETNKSAG